MFVNIVIFILGLAQKRLELLFGSNCIVMDTPKIKYRSLNLKIIKYSERLKMLKKKIVPMTQL